MKHVTIMAFVLLPFLGCDTEKPKFEVEEKTTSEKTVDSIGNLAWSLRNNNPDSTLVLAKLQLNLAKEIGYQHGISDALNIIGIAYWTKGNLDKALSSYFKSLKIREEVLEENPDNLALKGEVSKVLNNIGLIFVDQENYSKALEYFREDQKIKNAVLAEDPDNMSLKSGLSVTLGNIGMVLARQSWYEEATRTYFKSLRLAREVGNKNQESYSLNNIAALYERQGDPARAFDYYNQSLKLAEEIGNKGMKAQVLINLGEIYKDKENFAKALEYSQKACNIAERIGNMEYLLEAYLVLSEIYAGMDSIRNAYSYFKMYASLRNSLLDKESTKQIAEISIRFETNKKKKEIRIQKLEIEKKDANIENQRTWLVVGVGIVLIIAMFALFLLRLYRQKKKANFLLERSNAKITKQKEDITDSIRYASDIQKAILPTDEQVKKLLPDSFVLFKPKDIVSGDFYWMTKIDNDKILFAACDCTGHGVPGALMHMMINALLNEAVKEKGITKPSEIFYEVRSGIINFLKQTNKVGGLKDGMDAVLCIWDKTSNILEFAAANNSLFLMRDGQLEETKPDKQPVGFYEGEQNPFTNHKIELQKGDLIYIFSDGYADQFGGSKNKKFMRKRFKSLLLSIQDRSMNKQKEVLDKSIEGWKGEEEQVDDILVIGIKI